MISNGLKKILKTENIAEHYIDESLNCVALKESDKCSKIKKIILKGISTNAIVLKLDNSYFANRLLKKSKGVCRKCDYIIIAEKCCNLEVMLIEIKSNLDRNSTNVTQKMKSSYCIFNYLLAILKHFYNVKISNSQIKYKYVLFYYSTKPKKQTTEIKSINTNYDDPAKIPIQNNIKYSYKKIEDTVK